MNIIQTNTNPIEGVSFEKGILKCYGDVYLTGEPLKDMFSILYDYFLPNSSETLKVVKEKLEKEVFPIDVNRLHDGYNKIKEEIHFEQGLIRLELILYFKNTSTPHTEHNSYTVELTSVKSFEFYDRFGKRQHIELTVDEIYDIIEDDINQSIY